MFAGDSRHDGTSNVPYIGHEHREREGERRLKRWTSGVSQVEPRERSIKFKGSKVQVPTSVVPSLNYNIE